MRIGIDLGGTKIEVLALGSHGEELFRKRVATPQGDYSGTIQAMVALVEATEKATGQKAPGVGIATPGAISPATGLMKNSNSTCLNGKPLDKDLAGAIGKPVRLANDANCFALSEAIDGAGAGAEVVFGVILGTGTGGGIVVRGHVLTGPNAIAGEWGHNPLPWPGPGELPGPPCYCGKRGCIETFLSGPGLSRDHEARSGQRLDAAEIAKRAGQGDRSAQSTMDHYVDRLARALASVINIVDPDVVVLGGGLSNIAALYEKVPLVWGRYAFSDAVGTRLVQAKHGDSSGVRGAAWLWP